MKPGILAPVRVVMAALLVVPEEIKVAALNIFQRHFYLRGSETHANVFFFCCECAPNRTTGRKIVGHLWSD
ncbi:hypothetical protein KCP78_11265 [Salmonella enterica subsp. enterica]|nr:hypothetical protein KCP78_11265 [Salmonella enterica subsp. enterica]